MGVAFLFSTRLVSHSGLLCLSELVAELLSHLGLSSVDRGYFYATLSFDLSNRAGDTLGASYLIWGKDGDTIGCLAWLS